MQHSPLRTRSLVEGALMVAMGTVLSVIPFIELPHGGSITWVSSLPLIVMAFRWNLPRALGTAFVASLIQLFMGIKNLAYCQTLTAQAGCILLDYLLAFTALGLAGLLGRVWKNRYLAVGTGTVLVCLLRYLCSFLSGYLVWRDYDYAFEWMTNFGWGRVIAGMGENALCWLYSAVYNATYMIPETLLTLAAGLLLMRAAPKLFLRQDKAPLQGR